MGNGEETTRDLAAKSDVEHRNPNCPPAPCPLPPAPCPLNPPSAQRRENSGWGRRGAEKPPGAARQNWKSEMGIRRKGRKILRRKIRRKGGLAWSSFFCHGFFCHLVGAILFTAKARRTLRGESEVGFRPALRPLKPRWPRTGEFGRVFFTTALVYRHRIDRKGRRFRSRQPGRWGERIVLRKVLCGILSLPFDRLIGPGLVRLAFAEVAQEIVGGVYARFVDRAEKILRGRARTSIQTV